jgi:hypothetical protein
MDYDDYDDDGKRLPAEIPFGDDGVADAADDAEARIFGGRPILKYSDRQYTCGKNRDEVPLRTKKIFLSTTHYWQPWLEDPDDPDRMKPGKPVVRKRGQPLPERDELKPAYDDKSLWRVYNGQPQDPWQETRAILFQDLETGEQCVFVTTAAGGHGAVIDLCRAIRDKRETCPGACPIVELRWENMDTRHGMKTKPLFTIVGWRGPGGEALVERSPNGRPAETKKLVAQKNDMSDEIPF